MSRLAMNTRALARCYTCQLASSPAAASGAAPLLSRQALRLASTATKPAKAPKAKPAVDVAAVPKKKISTKSTTPAAPKTTTTTATRKKTAASAPAPALETAAAPAAPAKRSTTTRASSTKATSSASPAKSATTSATKKKAAAATTTTTRKASSSSSSSKQQQEPPASDLRKKTPSATKDGQQAARPSDSGAGTPLSTPGTTPSGEAGASRNPGVGTAPRPSATNAPPSRSDVLSSMHKDKPSEPPVHPDKPPTAADPSGGAGGQYKQAASRYTRIMVALPILLVTSYYLFDRLGMGNPQKSLEQFRSGGSSSSKSEGE